MWNKFNQCLLFLKADIMFILLEIYSCSGKEKARGSTCPAIWSVPSVLDSEGL